MKEFEYGIIGGGPAGYTSGIMLANQGHSVVLFEKDKIGGTCLNKGCIPTKTLLHISQIYSELISADSLGISAENISLDFQKIIDKKNLTIEKIRNNLEFAVKKSGVTIVYAEACIKDKIIYAGDEVYKVDKIITATGSKPKQIKGLEFDGNFILSSDDLLNMKELPKSILIAGSGAIGIEWSRIFNNFGVEVSIVEMAEHLIPSADIEVSKRIERIFKQKKIPFYLNDFIKNINGGNVVLNSGKVIEPEKILVAAGREPVCPDCDCESVIGDACGEIQLAHYAIHQAKQEVLGIPFDKNLVPSVIYGEPEIAWVGIREQDTDESYSKTVLPISALGKAWCDDSTDGFIKFITKDNKICGAHIVSKEASALIHTILIAIQNNLTTEDLKKSCFAHPTYSEGLFEALMRIN